jgi:hypothetical protein
VLRGLGQKLGVRTRGGDRVPQLARCIRDEAAHARLGAPQCVFGCAARVERRFDLPEHGVQREPEAPDLRSLLCPLDAPREIAAADRGGGRADGFERAEREPDDPPGEEQDAAESRGRDGTVR